MYFFTHLYIAKELYGQLSKNILLDYNTFSYGNIKLDISSKNRQHNLFTSTFYNFITSSVTIMFELYSKSSSLSFDYELKRKFNHVQEEQLL